MKRRVEKRCAVCGCLAKVILYENGTYRGGHYFGKIPLYTKQEIKKALGAGTRRTSINGRTINVMKKEPKPYAWKEYWECPKCYWRK